MKRKTPARHPTPHGKGRNGKAPHITIEQYEALFKSFSERQLVEPAAKAAGVGKNTAYKYIHGDGDPAAGMPPLYPRWLKLQADSAKKADNSLAKLRAKNMKIADVIMNRLTDKLLHHFDVDKLSEDKVAAQFKDTALIRERVLGAADTTVAVKGDGQFEGWTLQEKIEYGLTGKIPAGRSLVTGHSREDADAE